MDLLGTLFGISEAILIAFNINLNTLGYILFLVSSIFYCVYAYKTQQKNLLILNMVFSVINIIGIIRYYI